MCLPACSLQPACHSRGPTPEEAPEATTGARVTSHRRHQAEAAATKADSGSSAHGPRVAELPDALRPATRSRFPEEPLRVLGVRDDDADQPPHWSLRTARTGRDQRRLKLRRLAACVGTGPPTLQPMRQLIHTAAAIQGRTSHTLSARPMRRERIATKVSVTEIADAGTSRASEAAHDLKKRLAPPAETP